MSHHLKLCATEVDGLHLRLKLALMCFADYARDRDRVTFPGHDTIRKWTGVSKSQVHNLINGLIELQLLARHKDAHRGQRAEYVLFPNGCCELHGKRPAGVVEDGGDVVFIAGNPQPEPPGGWPSMTFSTAFDDHAQAVDPLPGERVQSATRKGPISDEKGSNPDPGKGPIVERENRRLEVPPVSALLTEPLPGGTTTEATHVARAVPSNKPVDRGLSVGALRAADDTCQHCDGGWIHDAAGLRAAPCLRCAAGRRAARSSA